MRLRYTYLLVLLLNIPLYPHAQTAPLEFIENQGQWSGAFAYKTITGRGDIYLEQDGLTYVIGLPSNEDRMDAFKHGQIKEPPVLKFHAYKMVFENAKKAVMAGSKKQPHYYNYFLGKDEARWKSGIHPYLAMDYQGIYDGIDIHVASERGNLKYDFIVRPGADAGQIRLRYDGVDKLVIEDQNLIVKTSVGNVMEMKPYAYQLINGEKTEVSCRYKLSGNAVSYSFPKGYDQSALLVIDPTVVFSTFTGSTADNWGFTATYDDQGYFYAGGLVNGLGYPVSTGAFQLTFAGGSGSTGSFYPCDMGIMKLSPAGSTKMWATYIGGVDNDQPHSMIVDGAGNLVIVGRTYSADYPVTAGSFDNSHNGGGDIVVTKLNTTATALVGSTFVGGSGDDCVNISAAGAAMAGLKHNYGDDARSEVIVDNQNNIYLTASTQSTNFPTTANAFQNGLAGFQDAVIVKLDNTLSNLLWSTYLGGNSEDAGYVLKLGANSNTLYVAGGTASFDFPTTTGTLWPAYQGGTTDGFVCRFLNAAPYTLQKTTFIGQADYDQVYGIELDIADNVYVMGQTLGGGFPVTSGVYSNPGSSQFIMKLDPDLSANIFSTVFGSGTSTATNISPVAFLVDTCNNIYISGWGGGLGFSPPDVGTTDNMPMSGAPNLPADPTTDGNDFYFAVFSPNATSLLYSTYFGRESADPGKGEHVDGGTSRFDKHGIVYQAICGGCLGDPTIPVTAFPTTPGSLSPVNNAANCNEVALKIKFDLSYLSAHAVAGPDTAGCPPFQVTFTNQSTSASTFEWNFGDSSPIDTTASPIHTFQDPGVYVVRLVANNPNACNASSDTTYITIVVDTNGIDADFDYVVTDSCNPYKATFTNTSNFSSTPGSLSFTKFIWTFGDGSAPFIGKDPGSHSFPDTGCYLVRLLMMDSTACNVIDSVEKLVCLRGFLLKAAFISPDSVCLGQAALMSNGSVNHTSHIWDLGDGNTTGNGSPYYTYTTPGSYTIVLATANPNSCNKVDTARRIIKVNPGPVAAFDYAPFIPEPNMPVRFTNLSTDAILYNWSFGDGTGSTDEHPEHLYRKTGTYTVCLVARNTGGCIDTVCKPVMADIYPAIDVPTGFSPNGDGVNDILYVRGAAVEKMNFKVFNRWGELLFETNDMAHGWDGNFKGKLQEMEAYAWTLKATFVDGSTAEKSGNVTLLR
jgi:gliding motility-associated-like protein